MGERTDAGTAAVDNGVDARDERIERVSTLHAEITAATREFLRAVFGCDQHRDWQARGFGSCAEWLAWLLGIKHNAANERVRAARALEHLPLTSEAMGRGEVSFSKVRALTRVATPDNEAELLELAKAGSTDNLERVVRAWKELDREGEAKADAVRRRTRRLSVFPDHDGMYVVRGRLTPEVGALLMRAIEAASDALYVEERRAKSAVAGAESAVAGAESAVDAAETPEGTTVGPAGIAEPQRRSSCPAHVPGSAHSSEPTHPRESVLYTPPECDGAEDRRAAARRRADAIGLLAERALAAGFSGEGRPISGSRAERYQVVLHVEPSTLTQDLEPGRSELADGTRVSAETARRLSCDASRIDVIRGGGGEVLDVGRKTRTVPGVIRRALEVRDRGCRFPACHRRFTDAHHIEHWGDGGETKLTNLVLLCSRHHTAVHEGGVRVFSDKNGQIVFFTPDGRPFEAAPPARRLKTLGAGALIARNGRRDVEIDPLGGMPRYGRDGYIPWEIEAAAWEALDPPAYRVEAPRLGPDPGEEVPRPEAEPDKEVAGPEPEPGEKVAGPEPEPDEEAARPGPPGRDQVPSRELAPGEEAPRREPEPGEEAA